MTFWNDNILEIKAMAPHSSTLAWKIPWTEEPGRLQSMGSLRVGHNWATSLLLFTFMHWRRKWQPTPVFLPGESQGWGSLVGCRLRGCTVGHDWSDLAFYLFHLCDLATKYLNFSELQSIHLFFFLCQKQRALQQACLWEDGTTVASWRGTSDSLLHPLGMWELWWTRRWLSS